MNLRPLHPSYTIFWVGWSLLLVASHVLSWPRVAVFALLILGLAWEVAGMRAESADGELTAHVAAFLGGGPLRVLLVFGYVGFLAWEILKLSPSVDWVARAGGLEVGWLVFVGCFAAWLAIHLPTRGRYG
jgi:hypothetical protein